MPGYAGLPEETTRKVGTDDFAGNFGNSDSWFGQQDEYWGGVYVGGYVCGFARAEGFSQSVSDNRFSDLDLIAIVKLLFDGCVY